MTLRSQTAGTRRQRRGGRAASPAITTTRRRHWAWAATAAAAVALVAHLGGVRRQLPYTPEVDEPTFVVAAINIAATGDWNPHWFGNPGSTVIYPLAVAFRVAAAAAHGAPLLGPAPAVSASFSANPSAFYLAGRLLTAAYGVACVPLLFVLARRCFGPRVAVAAAWLWAVNPYVTGQAQMVRTDSAGTFFFLLSTLLILRAGRAGGWRSHAAAGLVIGLAASTRYFLASLLLLIAAVDVGRFMDGPGRGRLRRTGAWLLVGVAAAGIGFALSSPYVLLDRPAALASLHEEARDVHLGADGLSPAGNLLYYLTRAIPASLTPPIAALAVAGAWLAFRRRAREPLLLAAFSLVFVAAVSLFSLHWQRWIIQILPLLTCLAADAALTAGDSVARFLRLGESRRRAAPGVVIALLALWPGTMLAFADIRQSRPTTRTMAREWLLASAPRAARIAQEWYCAPLAREEFFGNSFARVTRPAERRDLMVLDLFALSHRPLEEYRRHGVDYLVASSLMYERYRAEPDRYPAERAFYDRLFATGGLVKEFVPGLTRGGPVIRILRTPGR